MTHDHTAAYHLASAAIGVWSMHTAADVGPSLSCREAEGLAIALDALGHTELAVTLLSGHANGDENPAEVDTDDEHYHLAGAGISGDSPEILRYLAAIKQGGAVDDGQPSDADVLREIGMDDEADVVDEALGGTI